MVINAYKITAIYSVIAMILAVFLMACMGYMLSKRNLKGKTTIAFIVYFTTLFSGGLVPCYILNTQVYHLNDTILIYILPGLISPMYVFMMRTFMQDVPVEITESATIDGANEYTIFASKNYEQYKAYPGGKRRGINNGFGGFAERNRKNDNGYYSSETCAFGIPVFPEVFCKGTYRRNC